MKSMRKCAGCGELKPKDEMIKLTKNYKDGKIIVNPNSETFGRSAYLCYNQSCIDAAFKKSKLNKVLKTNVLFEKSAFCAMLQEKESNLQNAAL